MTRLPTHSSAAAVRELAEQFDLSYSETVAELVRLGLERAEDFIPPGPAQQEALPLKAS